MSNFDKICKIADKWCGLECHVSVYPYRPEWCVPWRYDEDGGYEVVTNDPEIYRDKITIGIIVSRDKYENMNGDVVNELCALERDVFIGFMIAAERDDCGIRLSKNERIRFVKYLKEKHSFSFSDTSI